MVRIVCDTALTSPVAKRQFVRAKIHIDTDSRELRVTPVRGQGSHSVGGLAQADCFIVIPEGQAATAAGDLVIVIDLRNG